MSKKQSSIEWLVKELNNNIDSIPMSKWDKIRDIVQKAKAMHKEEIIDAWIATDNELQRLAAEQYYNQTFKGQDNE